MHEIVFNTCFCIYNVYNICISTIIYTLRPSEGETYLFIHSRCIWFDLYRQLLQFKNLVRNILCHFYHTLQYNQNYKILHLYSLQFITLEKLIKKSRHLCKKDLKHRGAPCRRLLLAPVFSTYSCLCRECRPSKFTCIIRRLALGRDVYAFKSTHTCL